MRGLSDMSGLDSKEKVEMEVVCVSNKPYLTGEELSLEGTFFNLTIGKVYLAE
jgi:hypothetical protein